MAVFRIIFYSVADPFGWVINDNSEEEKICGCGYGLPRIGEEVFEQLDIVPARISCRWGAFPRHQCCRNCQPSLCNFPKNCLIGVTPEGAAASALFYRLIETAKAIRLTPMSHLSLVFEKLPTATTLLKFLRYYCFGMLIKT